MIRLSRFALVALAFGFASCAKPSPAIAPAAPAAVKNNAVSKSETPPKKRRLNGRGKLSSLSLTEGFKHQQAGDALIFDARDPYFYNQGHIAGAINMPKEHCDEIIIARQAEIKAALAANKPIIVYCTNFLCPDARTVGIHLADFGHSSFILDGGWDAWKEADLPTE